MVKQLDILGHSIAYKKLMDSKKVEAVANRIAPKTVKQFLGLTNYYRRHIKDYSKLATIQLTKKIYQIFLVERLQRCFKKIINKFSDSQTI